MVSPDSVVIWGSTALLCDPTCFDTRLAEKFVKALLVLHLCYCLFCCASTASNVLIDSPSSGFATSGSLQIFSAAWALIGVPTIAVALWGVYHRSAAHVRLYLYYGLADIVLDACFLVGNLLVRDACVHLDPAVAASSGRAFACGAARGFSAILVVSLLLIALYFLYIVRSYCQDLEDGGSAAVIAELLRGSRTEEKPYEAAGLAGGVGLACAAPSGAGFGGAAGAFQPYGGRAFSMASV